MPFRTSSVAALAVAACLPLAAHADMPLKISGLWCGVGLLHEFRLEMAQQFNLLEARLIRKQRIRQITGRIEGSMVRTDPQRNETLELQALGNELRVTSGTGPLALLKGQAFRRATADSCSR